MNTTATRFFTTVSPDFRKNINAVITLPKRKTRYSAGYDIHSPIAIVIAPGESILIWTDVKSFMQQDEVLEIYIRSSLAIKYGMQLKNQVGILDSDYFENESNDGNIGVCLYNTSDKPFEIKEGDAIAQGIFKKYLVIDGDETNEERTGGIGSTTK